MFYINQMDLALTSSLNQGCHKKDEIKFPDSSLTSLTNFDFSLTVKL